MRQCTRLHYAGVRDLGPLTSEFCPQAEVSGLADDVWSLRRSRNGRFCRAPRRTLASGFGNAQPAVRYRA
jgi:hypothetical protein